MEISKEIGIWAEKNTICIQVNPHYVYYAKVSRIGKDTDVAGCFTMYGWIKHLKEKVWWNNYLEDSFQELAEIMFKE